MPALALLAVATQHCQVPRLQPWWQSLHHAPPPARALAWLLPMLRVLWQLQAPQQLKRGWGPRSLWCQQPARLS